MNGTIGGVLSGTDRWCLIEGDCLEILPFLPDRSVQHCVTDPPYEAEAHTKQRRIKANVDGQGTQANGQDTRGIRLAPVPFPPIRAAQRNAAARQMVRVTSRWALAFCQVEAAPKWGAAFDRHGARYMRTCVWVKPDGQPQLTGDRPGMGYESIVVAHAQGRSRWNGGGRVGVFVHNTARFDGANHPTPKPLSLMLELVSLFTDPGELVLDPFAGSSTTGAACLRLGRRYLGIERDPAFAAISRVRLEAEARGQTPREFVSGQQHLFADAR